MREDAITIERRFSSPEIDHRLQDATHLRRQAVSVSTCCSYHAEGGNLVLGRAKLGSTMLASYTSLIIWSQELCGLEKSKSPIEIRSAQTWQLSLPCLN